MVLDAVIYNGVHTKYYKVIYLYILIYTDFQKFWVSNIKEGN